jgi:1-acyl-sn-glycerol-3-phosphate acyltransferase
LRLHTRPVAAADYWGSGIRRTLALRGFNAVLIERNRSAGSGDPLAPLYQALTLGDSLILFPEGTRRPQRLPGEFKSGLYHLAQRFPQVELVPVYIENLHRSMPKGTWLPVPLICTVRFGATLSCREDEDKNAFLERARRAVEELA